MNSYVDMGGGAYATDFARLQRQQQMADMLQQQAMEPVQAPQGATAPISLTNVLAKLVQGYAARRQSDRIDERYKALNAQDQDSANALVRQLTQQTNKVGTTDIAPVQTQLGGQTLTAPGAQGTGTQQVGPSQQEQMAALLAASGGPQVQGVRNAMLPQIIQRQNMDYQHQLGRDDAAFERAQPMSVAAQQTMDAQEGMARRQAQFTNSLGPTQLQNAQLGLEREKLADEKQKTKLMYGSGDLSANNPVGDAWVKSVTDGSVPGINNVPKQYRDYVAVKLSNAQQAVFVPQAGRRFGMTSNQIVGPLMKLPQYELTAQGLPFIQRIKAASEHPGSVADQELLDSFTKLSTAGNAVTDAQVRIITDGKTVNDWAHIQMQKLAANGGVLSPQQRKDIQTIAGKTYEEYRKGYEPLYKEAAEKLTAAGIPKPFWTIPDLNKLNAVQTGGGGADPNADAKAWLAANPNDPRAAAVRAKLGTP